MRLSRAFFLIWYSWSRRGLNWPATNGARSSSVIGWPPTIARGGLLLDEMLFCAMDNGARNKAEESITRCHFLGLVMARMKTNIPPRFCSVNQIVSLDSAFDKQKAGL